MTTALFDPPTLTAADRRRLAEENLKLVWAVAHLHRAEAARRGLELDDLAGQGTLGLLRAAELYDPARSRFSTFAVRWIRLSMMGLLRPRRRPEPAEEWILLEAPAREEDPPAGPAELEWLAGALDRLPGPDALAIRVRFGVGRERGTFDELARLLGVSREGARRRVHRALVKLRRMHAEGDAP